MRFPPPMHQVPCCNHQFTLSIFIQTQKCARQPRRAFEMWLRPTGNHDLFLRFKFESNDSIFSDFTCSSTAWNRNKSMIDARCIICMINIKTNWLNYINLLQLQLQRRLIECASVLISSYGNWFSKTCAHGLWAGLWQLQRRDHLVVFYLDFCGGIHPQLIQIGINNVHAAILHSISSDSCMVNRLLSSIR